VPGCVGAVLQDYMRLFSDIMLPVFGRLSTRRVSKSWIPKIGAHARLPKCIRPHLCSRPLAEVMSVQVPGTAMLMG
jgi:hypothetical protein